MVACVTSGLSAPGVRCGSARSTGPPPRWRRSTASTRAPATTKAILRTRPTLGADRAGAQDALSALARGADVRDGRQHDDARLLMLRELPDEGRVRLRRREPAA